MKRVFALSMLIVLVGAQGCLFDTADDGDRDYSPPIVVDLSAPDSLIKALTGSWEQMDLSSYAEILYDGETPVPGMDPCMPFEFYFLNPGVGGIPGEPWFFTDEISCFGNIMEGRDGKDPVNGSVIPAVDNIRITMTISPAGWSVVNDGAPGVYDDQDPYPAGTMRGVFYVSIVFILTRENDGGFNAYAIDNQGEFLAIPVIVDGRTEYRLWKWRDCQYWKAGVSEGCTISGVKSLYILN
ncbi:MAG: hypothetical protein GY835_10955 [bacterium]|nr:hypothetical protein [bacterium]